jgi:arylsulfatase
MNKKPNILHLFTDMQRFDTIHALGNGVIKTPNLDRLVKNGVAFTSCYSPSPVCISARCSMIYGQYPNNTGCYENTTMPEDGRQSFMGALTQGGYRDSRHRKMSLYGRHLWLKRI